MSRLSRFLRSLASMWRYGHTHCLEYRDIPLAGHGEFYCHVPKCQYTENPEWVSDLPSTSRVHDWSSFFAELRARAEPVKPLGSAVKEAPVPEATPEAYTPPPGLPFVLGDGEGGSWWWSPTRGRYVSPWSTGAPAPTDASSTSTPTPSPNSRPSTGGSSW